ncbi:MAG: DUF664 domain-containing protein [Gemmatimonadetes bacterium]|nr:DUF664 domain-containing protein [Gemmatimonadota bacterium]
MHPSVVPLAAILRTNTELLLNCLQGLDDTRARQRLTQSTNSIAFLVAHLIQCRHAIGSAVGAPLPDPMGRYLDAARTLDDVAVLPTVAELRGAWERISAHLAVEIERLDTPKLRSPGRRVPGADGTVLGEIAYLVQHDSYHLGQVSLLRRQVGLPPMSLRVEPREPGRLGA